MFAKNKRMMSIALALIAVALAGNGVVLNSYNERLTAIERKFSTLAPPPSGTIAERSPMSNDSPGTVQSYTRPQAPGSTYHAPPLNVMSPEGVEERRRNRLAKLAAVFERERVDNHWAAQTEAHVRDALTYAAATSGVEPIGSSVKCRSSSCRIEVDMPPSADPEDLLLQLSVDMSETLPRSRTVVLPDGKGNKRLSIFAAR